MASAEDLEAKRRFIDAFFKDLRKKAGFTDQLFADGHEDEARLLVCCYIEALGNGLDPSNGYGARNFVTALVEYGGNPILGLVHPKLLRSSLPFKGIAQAIKQDLEAAFDTLPAGQALSELELLVPIEPLASPDALAFLKRELWRTRIASVAYSNIRSLGAHWFGSPGSVSFSLTTHQGQAIPEINFSTLRQALDRIMDYAEELSLTTNKWFGHS